MNKTEVRILGLAMTLLALGMGAILAFIFGVIYLVVNGAVLIASLLLKALFGV